MHSLRVWEETTTFPLVTCVRSGRVFSSSLKFEISSPCALPRRGSNLHVVNVCFFCLGRSRGYCIWSRCAECSRTDPFIQCFLWQITQGLEFGELHLCPDSTPPSRERGRSGCHKRKNIFWSCGQYSESLAVKWNWSYLTKRNSRLPRLSWVVGVGFAFGEHSSKTTSKRTNEIYLWKCEHGGVLVAGNKTKCEYYCRWKLFLC